MQVIECHASGKRDCHYVDDAVKNKKESSRKAFRDNFITLAARKYVQN